MPEERRDDSELEKPAPEGPPAPPFEVLGGEREVRAVPAISLRLLVLCVVVLAVLWFIRSR